MSENTKEIRVYENSDLFYWWIVWVYGGFCGCLSYFQGNAIPLGGKNLMFYQDAWLGISFLALLLFVIFFTHVRARGVWGLVWLMGFFLICGAVEYLYGWQRIFLWLPLLRIHVNAAFYFVFSAGIFAIWLFAVFVLNRFTLYVFRPGKEIEKIDLLWGEDEVTAAQTITVRKRADDFIVHRLLGLWFLGYGTGDLSVSFDTAAGHGRYTIKNVWRAKEKERMITTLIGSG